MTTPPTTPGWRRLQLLMLLLLVAYAVTVLIVRFWAALEPWSVDGDQHQSIGQYWRYHLDGAMPPGALITDYAFAYHAPPVWWAIMAGLSTFIEPLAAAKAMGVVVYCLIGASATLLVGRRTDWVLGCAVGALALRSPDLPEQITGGMARSMAPALLFCFLLAFSERRHYLVLLILVLQAGIYPSGVIACGLTYGAWCVLKGPMNERLRRCASMFVAGLLIILLGKAQDFKAPAWWGDVVTYAEAEQMRAWHAGGRFGDVPHRPAGDIISANFERPYKSLGHSPLPDGVRAFLGDRVNATVVILPAGLAVAGIVWGRFRRRRSRALPRGPDEPLPLPETPAVALPEAPPEPPPAALPDFPWPFLWLLAGAFVAYFLSRVVAFKLFLPSRQLGFTIQYIVETGLPMLCWYGASCRWPGRPRTAVLVAVLLAVVPAFVIRGDGLGASRAGYFDHAGDAALFAAVQRLPLDEQIACDVDICEMMMVLGHHAPYAAQNLTHPLRKGYYEEAERRLVAMHGVLYATSAQTILDFVASEHVRYFAYNTASVKQIPPRMYHPARERIQPLFDAGKDLPRLLQDPPKAAVFFRVGPRIVLDLAKLPAALGAPPAPPAP